MTPRISGSRMRISGHVIKLPCATSNLITCPENPRHIPVREEKRFTLPPTENRTSPPHVIPANAGIQRAYRTGNGDCIPRNDDRFPEFVIVLRLSRPLGSRVRGNDVRGAYGFRCAVMTTVRKKSYPYFRATHFMNRNGCGLYCRYEKLHCRFDHVDIGGVDDDGEDFNDCRNLFAVQHSACRFDDPVAHIDD